jgi:hypothetical protein
LRWELAGVDGLVGLCVLRCVHPVDRRAGGGSTSSGSGKRSLTDCRARRPQRQPGCHPRSGRGGSVKVAAAPVRAAPSRPHGHRPPMARRCQVPMFAESDVVTDGARTEGGPRRGARNRSRTGSGSTSLMMSPCGSRTRPSIKRPTSKGVVPSVVSWLRVCARAGRFGHRGPGDGARSSSPRRS